MDDMVPYHKFSNHRDQQVHDKLRENILHLPKDIINWSMNSITTKMRRNSVQNSSIQGYSRLAKIERVHQLSQRQ